MMACKSASIFAAARSLRAVCILALLFSIGVMAFAAGSAANPGSASTSSNSTIAAVANSGKAPAKPAPTAKPIWADLTPVQQAALAPLSAEWDKLDTFRKKKWLEIGNKYSSMKPDEQLRVQERMREWAKLTPEQRRVARESYARTKKLNPDQKSAHWQEYQQLSEEQKLKLANDATSKKHVANLPPTKSKSKTVPPIKSTAKPVLPKPLTPPTPNQVAVPPTPQPAVK
jgi:Protein of unknown function (DUF3106)